MQPDNDILECGRTTPFGNAVGRAHSGIQLHERGKKMADAGIMGSTARRLDSGMGSYNHILECSHNHAPESRRLGSVPIARTVVEQLQYGVDAW